VLDEYSHEMIVHSYGGDEWTCRCTREPVNKNGELLNEFVFENELENLNVTMAERKVTWSNKENCSAIDYILVNANARRKVMCMWVDEAGVFYIKSDHDMLVTELKMHDTHVRELDKKCKRRVKGVDWDNFSAKLTDTEWGVANDVNV
jgi:endonuclease/exonuclease/phosphatase family metal-dependent hydrolase